MSKVIQVKYERGMLKPLDPVDFLEGEEVRMRTERSARDC